MQPPRGPPPPDPAIRWRRSSRTRVLGGERRSWMMFPGRQAGHLVAAAVRSPRPMNSRRSPRPRQTWRQDRAEILPPSARRRGSSSLPSRPLSPLSLLAGQIKCATFSPFRCAPRPRPAKKKSSMGLDTIEHKVDPIARAARASVTPGSDHSTTDARSAAFQAESAQHRRARRVVISPSSFIAEDLCR